VRPLLEVSDLVRHWPGVRALDRVDLEVAAGEVVALLGENGAGKSTLVEILGGGLRPHGGEVKLDGRPFCPRDPRQAAEQGVAVVHQHFQLVEAFTVEENLRLAMRGRSREAVARSWAALEERLGLALPPPGAVVAALGLGDRQRVELGKALAWGPRLLLLDEPTAVLTPRESEDLFEAVRRLAGEGTAIVFITHRLDEVRRVADRAVVLRQGRVAASLPADAAPVELAVAMTGERPSPATASARRLGDVVARLRGVAAPPRLAPFDLELRSGEIVVLAGVDGNGQVVAAERLAGLECGPGVVEVRGEELRGADPETLRRRGVWVIPADRVLQGLAPSLTVAENLALGRHRRPPLGRRGWLNHGAVAEQARQLITAFAVAGKPGQAAGELSGGNQQKLVVARALAARPLVLVAIHPTRGLDVTSQNQVRRDLMKAAGEGVALLVVTADLEEARLLGDRILVLSHGRVMGEGDRETPRERIAAWIGGEAA